ncbi:MAG TPA: sulfite exporter TauE/SafE family protein [Chloroflexota bacterium]|nr:sulfite exporter TauE/SafE family protein [Chloroflexota bacterium]
MPELPALLGFMAAAYVVATLVVMTGFGLSTSLTPLFALVYPTQIAVMLVAVVHFLNNVFRVGLFRKHVDLALIRRFGFLSIAGALAGSLAQGWIQGDWLKLLLGVSLLVLGSIEALPGLSGWRFSRRFDQAGGLLSGLLGGLLGNQGAVRSAYLVNYDIPKESFVATATLIAIFIDATRLPVYLWLHGPAISTQAVTLAGVTLAAWAGTYTGKRLVTRISQRAFKRSVSLMVVAFGFLMLGQGAYATLGVTGAAAVLAAAGTLLALAAARTRRPLRSPSSVQPLPAATA